MKYKPVYMFQEEESIIEPNRCYYLTLNIVDRVDIFIKPVFKQVIVESLNYFIEKKGLIIYGWCLMSNHLHLAVRTKDGFDLAQVIKDFKIFTAKIILEDIDAESEVRRNWMMKKFKEAFVFDHFQVWQTSDQPVCIDLKKRNNLHECLQHIHNNPVRNKIVSAPQDYLHSSSRNYLGFHGLVKVQLPGFRDETDHVFHNAPSYTYAYQKTYE